MSTIIQTWYDFVLQQMAAESYLDKSKKFGGALDTDVVLMLGSNNPDYPQNGQIPTPTTDILLGATRMTATQAADFTTRYEIISHLPNTASGFSGTLLFDNQTRQYTLSFRSTEYRNQVDGGDWERDGLPGADGEIQGYGFAIAQIDAMEKYYAELKSSGLLPAGAVLNVTGYSLSGHLATVFSELHQSEINQTYTFNAAGRGQITGSIAQMLDYYRAVLQDPTRGLVDLKPEFQSYYTAAIAASGAINATNIYLDARERWAARATSLHFSN